MVKNNKRPESAGLQIGPWLKVLGRKPGEVAEKAGINEGYFSQLISGKKAHPSFDLVARLADELGIPIDHLRRMPPDQNAIEAIRSLDPTVLNRIRRKSRDPD